MKRFFSKSEYFKWGVTAFLVIAASLAFYMLLTNGQAFVATVRTITGILSPIIWGLVIAYLLWPSVKILQKKALGPLLKKLFPKRDLHRLARALSILIAIVVALLLVAMLVYLVVPQLYDSVESIVTNSPQYYQTVSDWITNFLKDYPQAEQILLEATGNASQNLADFARNAVLPYLSKIITSLSTGLYSVLRAILNILVGFVVACYVLGNIEIFSAKCKKILYSVFSVKSTDNILAAVRFTDRAFNGFINGKIIDSAIIGVLCYVVCSILNMPYTVLVSVVVGVTNIIPVFGPFIGGIPTALIILLVSPTKALIYVIFIIILQQIDGNIIGPKILGSSIGINGFWIMFAILLGGGLFGVIGMVLAVPLFAVLYSGIGLLVDRRLKKRGLATETADYVDILGIDPETLEPIPAHPTPAEAAPPSAESGK
ncbi:MAG: AI-2E family transporter [Oscillospiraceae bacterium]|nr:AI-2E family transporter [Oscillospiraceae bacterium]